MENYEDYNKLVDRLNAIDKVRITDSKFLQVMINLAPEIADQAIKLINKYGLNKAMKAAKDYNPNILNEKEIDRIKEIARIYLELKSLLPNYENEYLEAYLELANRFDKVRTSKLSGAEQDVSASA